MTSSVAHAVARAPCIFPLAEGGSLTHDSETSKEEHNGTDDT